jgi:heme-degrading monooxygenase HmoA
MSDSSFAKTPRPPYYAVIFSARRTEGDQGYAETAERMSELVSQHPGFLGVESTRGADGFGITVAYFDSEDAIRAWKRDLEHTAAREQGRKRWYSHYEVRVARVERAYNFDAPEID